MKKEELIQKFIDCPSYLDNGYKYLCKKFNINKIHKDVIKECKAIARSKIKNAVWIKEHLEFDKPKNYNKSNVNIIKSINSNNTLILPDLHFPFEKQGILDHCVKMKEKYNCSRIICIGDEVDLCAISQWEKDPDGFSGGTEAQMAQEKMKELYELFPITSVCIGNHTARPFRMAKSSGLPKKFIKSYEEAWEAPKGWKWSESWEFNNVLYTHGTGYSGANAAIRIATRHRQNTVIGHIHSEAGIQYSASKIDLVWGMQVGGAIDDKSYAAHYAKDNLKKSIVGCGIVVDGVLPIFEPMNL